MSVPGGRERRRTLELKWIIISPTWHSNCLPVCDSSKFLDLLTSSSGSRSFQADRGSTNSFCPTGTPRVDRSSVSSDEKEAYENWMSKKDHKTMILMLFFFFTWSPLELILSLLLAWVICLGVPQVHLHTVLYVWFPIRTTLPKCRHLSFVSPSRVLSQYYRFRNQKWSLFFRSEKP